MHVKDIKATVSRVKAVSAGVGGFIGRHKRASIAVGAALLLAGPLVTGDGNVLVYSQGTGRAAALVHRSDGSLEVAAVLGMRWEPGKLVSRRSLRGLKPLAAGRRCG